MMGRSRSIQDFRSFVGRGSRLHCLFFEERIIRLISISVAGTKTDVVYCTGIDDGNGNASPLLLECIETLISLIFLMKNSLKSSTSWFTCFLGREATFSLPSRVLTTLNNSLEFDSHSVIFVL